MAVKLLEKEKSLFDEAKKFSLRKIAPYADKWENGEKTSRDAMNKLFATEVAMDTITKCLQLFGENGFDKLSVLSRYFSVAKLLQIVDGTSEIQKIVIGRDLERQVI